MKKNKILLSFITSLSMIGMVSIPLSSCGKKEDLPVETKYKISFKDSEGVKLSFSEPIEVKTGTKWSEVNKPKESIEQSYIGYYWCDENNNELKPDFVITRDIEVKFLAYKEDSVKTTLKFMSGDTEHYKKDFYKGKTFKDFKDKNSDFKEPTAPQHCSFDSWYIDDEKNIITDAYIFPFNDQKEFIINAKFLPKMCYVHFFASDGVELSSYISFQIQEGKTWKEVAKPRTTVQPGWTGISWVDITSGAPKELKEDSVIEEKDTKVKYVALENSKTFIDVNIKVDDQTHGPFKYIQGGDFKTFKEYYELETPKKEHYDYAGCYAGGTKLDDSYTFPQQQNITIEAQFTPITRSVKFSASQGVTLMFDGPISVNEGTLWKDVKKPEVYVMWNFQQVGWFNANTNLPLTDDVVINDNISAKFIALEKKSIIDVILKKPDSTVTLKFLRGYTFKQFKEEWEITDPKIKGLVFMGWYVGNNQITDSFILPDQENITIEAIFKADFATCDWNFINDRCHELENGSITKDEFCKCFVNGAKPITSLDDFIGLERGVQINGQNHIVRVIGTQHDVLTTKSEQGVKAVFTFELVTLLSGSDGNAITSKWDGTYNFDYINSILRKNITGNGSASGPDLWSTSVYDMLPSDIQSAIKTVNKEVAINKSKFAGWDNYKITSYNDKLFPLTYNEMAQNTSPFVKYEGTTYAYCSSHNNNNDRIKKDAAGNPYWYWLASPYISDYTMRIDYLWLVTFDGLVRFNSLKAFNDFGVSFAFCI